MMTMEYPISSHHQHKYACSTMSSETLSGSCGSRSNRIRTIRLIKRSSNLSLGNRQMPSLGFSIRGGHEHGTGFFVSHVETGSEAHTQGLKVGDQIIRINGFTIEDAIHKEVLQLISTHTHLTLKVRSVGMIPVKDKKTDILSWQIVTETISSSRSSPQFIEKSRDVRISIMVAPRSKLGCGICKGPEWKPGIFVQFTKEGGIAREAGLRPGDQILQCNNVDFSDIQFNEAVNIMKTSRQLDLIIRKAAASELFPGESSGYNSSASSVTEDQSSSWGDSKRLSIVKEENNQNIDDRLHQRSSTSISWSLTDWEEEPPKEVYKPTIINVSDSGSTIKNNGAEYYTKHENYAPNSEAIKIPEQRDRKVVVEVHRSDDDDPPNRLSKSPSNSSLASKASVVSAASSSLSSAISMELKRRSEKKAAKTNEESIDDQIQKKKLIRGLSSDQQFQHTKLMNEFKQAHQKMFKSPSLGGSESQKASPVLGNETLERLAHKELSQKLSDRLLTLANNEATSSPPPPPPPPPSDQVSTPTTPASNSSTPKPKVKPKAPPVPIKRSVLSSYQPPPCPTPDYDTLSLSSTSSTVKPSPHNEPVEMDSLESFKINHPASVKPKPPNIYFKKNLCSKLSNGSVTSVEKPKGVHVSIGEYASVRTPPGKLNFLNLSRNSGDFSGGLASELTQTLNKSNLKKRTESMDNLLSAPQIRPQSNGTVRISVNNLAKEFAKSTNDLTEDYDVSSKVGNRITININQEKINGLDRKNTYGDR